MRLTSLFKAAITTALLSSGILAHADQLSTEKINDNMTVIKNKGGNILVVNGNKSALVIDNGYDNQAAEVLPTINKIAKGLPIQYVVNTHWHGDHTGSNEELGKQAAIIAHDNVRKRLSSPQSIPAFGMESKAYKPEGLPTLTYPESMHVHFSGDTLLLKHFANGHTDSDTIVFFKQANVVHMGDHMFYPMFPFVDIDNGGNIKHYIANVKAAYQQLDDKTIVVPGHGPVSNKQDVKQYIMMLEGTVAEVEAMMAKNMSLADMQKNGLSDFWKPYTKGFIKEAFWIETIYNSSLQ